MSQASKLKNVKWRKISAPTVWRPSADEELIGYYAGRTLRDGAYGQYTVILVAVPYKGTYMISGTKIVQLFDSAMLTRGEAVRVRFLGNVDLGDERTMKEFELYVGEIEAAKDLPAVDEVPPS